jgi:D-3-phosphoglycerate dehydrogenase
MRVLLTTTSFQDTPGEHHKLLDGSGFEIVRARGPLSEKQMIELISQGGGFDGLLNGDDQITAKVIDAALPRLKVIAKYGIGLDSIDVPYATQKRIPVLFTPGVNHTTVAEHAIGLMIAVAKSFGFHFQTVKNGQWKRQTGYELYGKTLGVLGVGRIGKEIVKRANAFGMKCIGYDIYRDEAFAS